MQILQCIDYLHGVALDFKFMEALSSLEQFIHTLVLTQFEKDVNVLSIFEKMLELADIVVFYTPVDFNFAHQLLFCTALCQTGLLNDLGSMDVIGVSIYELPTLCKSSLAQELALYVPSCSILVTLFKFLFNQGVLLQQVGLSIGATSIGSSSQHLI